MKSKDVWNLLYTLCNITDKTENSSKDILQIISLPNDAWVREGESYEHHPHVIRYIKRCMSSAKQLPMFSDLVLVQEIPKATRKVIETLLETGTLKNLPSRSIDAHVDNMIFEMKIRLAVTLQKELTEAIQATDLDAINAANQKYVIAVNSNNDIASLKLDRTIKISELFTNLCDAETMGVPVPTGWDVFDSRAKGIPGAGITYITAPVGHGKSHMVVHLAESIASEQELTVAVISLEMTNEEYLERVIRKSTGIQYEHALAFNDAATQQLVFKKAKETIRKMKGRLHLINPDGNEDIITHLEAARSLGARIVFVDYLQLYSSTNPRINRTEYLKSMPTRIKAWCLKHKIAVVLLAQLNDEGLIYGSKLSHADCDCWLSFEYPQEMRDVGQIEVQVKKHRHTKDFWSFHLYADYSRSTLSTVPQQNEIKPAARESRFKYLDKE
jgi:KaiC/GvpD/RAD55 family RecA-like ATPase